MTLIILIFKNYYVILFNLIRHFLVFLQSKIFWYNLVKLIQVLGEKNSFKFNAHGIFYFLVFLKKELH